MDKLKKLEEEIALLQKEKEKEELRIEVDKLKKTVVEEVIIRKRIVEELPYIPFRPYPQYNPDPYCTTTCDQNTTVTS